MAQPAVSRTVTLDVEARRRELAVWYRKLARDVAGRTRPIRTVRIDDRIYTTDPGENRANLIRRLRDEARRLEAGPVEESGVVVSIDRDILDFEKMFETIVSAGDDYRIESFR